MTVSAAWLNQAIFERLYVDLRAGATPNRVTR